MKKLLPLFIVLALGGCAEFQKIYGVVTGTTVTPQQAVVAINAFDAVEQSGTNYLRLPTCGPNVSKLCKTQAGVVAVVKAIRTARVARNQLQAAVTGSNGAPISASLLQALQSQYVTIQALYANYGIGQ